MTFHRPAWAAGHEMWCTTLVGAIIFAHRLTKVTLLTLIATL